MTKLASAALLALVGCATDPVDGVDAVPGKELPVFHGDLDSSEDQQEEAQPLVPLVTDMCDEPTYSGVSWQVLSTDHLVLSFLPGTEAAADAAAIAERLEAAYEEIRESLGVPTEPVIAINLSPSRRAAYAHNFGFGRAWPQANRYDVVYTGASDSYELQRYGQLLTTTLDFHINPNSRYRHPLLAVGVAELLDQSGRDLHAAYANNLAAGLESRVYFADFDSKDVNGRNVGRSGSLVQFLVDRYGMDTFMSIYGATAITWNSSYGCNWNLSIGCVSTPEQVTYMLDAALRTIVDVAWADLQPEWAQTVQAALDDMSIGMPRRATNEIGNVLRVMDHAISTDDAAEYRSTLEGFYCDWGGDDVRGDIAERAVTAYGQVHTQLLGLYDTGIKNFSTAQALVMRTEGNELPTFQTIQLEHVPAGWRVSWGPDWF
jgi:hypothetical protein